MMDMSQFNANRRIPVEGELFNKTLEECMHFYQTAEPALAYLAFEKIYRSINQNVYRFIFSKTQNTEISEDLMQKVFLKFHESKHLYSSKYKVEQWVIAIAKNTIIDEWRKNSKLPNIELNPIEHSINADNTQLKLSAEDKELLELKYIDELTYKEIAEILNKSEVSIRKFVNRLVHKLKREI